MKEAPTTGGKRAFRPGIYSTLAALLLGVLFAGLGYWQLQRAAEKESVIARRAAAEASAPVAVFASMASQDLHLKPVEVACEMDAQRQLLLDNRVHRQQVGYEVLIPCVLSDGVGVLLNRGWAKAGHTRDELPDVEVDTPQGAVTLSGHFAIPGQGFRLGEALTESDIGWPRRVQYLDFELIGQALSMPLLAGVVHLDPGSPLTLEYTWKPIAFGPEKHYGYAFQWFALLATLCVLYLVLNIKVRKSQERK